LEGFCLFAFFSPSALQQEHQATAAFSSPVPSSPKAHSRSRTASRQTNSPLCSIKEVSHRLFSSPRPFFFFLPLLTAWASNESVLLLQIDTSPPLCGRGLKGTHSFPPASPFPHKVDGRRGKMPPSFLKDHSPRQTSKKRTQSPAFPFFFRRLFFPVKRGKSDASTFSALMNFLSERKWQHIFSPRSASTTCFPFFFLPAERGPSFFPFPGALLLVPLPVTGSLDLSLSMSGHLEGTFPSPPPWSLLHEKFSSQDTNLLRARDGLFLFSSPPEGCK